MLGASGAAQGVRLETRTEVVPRKGERFPEAVGPLLGDGMQQRGAIYGTFGRPLSMPGELQLTTKYVAGALLTLRTVCG